MTEPERTEGTNARRPVNKLVIGIGVGLVAIIALAVYFSFTFVEDEMRRNQQAWQIRLGIVADSRAAAVNEWIEHNFDTMRELSENASLQLYMTELTLAGEEGEGEGEEGDDSDELAEATYLRNLLVATAERTGFKAPEGAGEIAANIEKVGVAGIGLVDADGKPIVSTPSMPPVTGKIRSAVAKALEGEPAIIDVFMGASNLPTMGFVLPVFAIQADETAKGIGAVVGMRVVGRELFDVLKQPGETEETSETYFVRPNATATAVEYLSPLADGTAPLKRSLDLTTPDLAAAYALERPGGFAIKVDYLGEEVLVASRPIANLPWVLLRKVSRAEALSATETRLNTILYVFISIIVGVTMAIVAVWRHGSSIRATQAAENYRIAADRMTNLSKFMRVVTNSQPTQIVAVSGDTTYTFANQPAADEGGITPEDMLGKTMASVIGPVRAKVYGQINQTVLAEFDAEDDVEKARQSHIHTFGEEDDDDLIVMRSDHIPLRGDRDFPPAVLMVLDDITELTRERRRSEQMLRQLINTLVSVVDRRDPFSANHSSRVAEVSRCIAQDMELPEIEVKTVDISGSLMNLGKIFVAPGILTKEGELTPEERNLMANSYTVSADLLENVPFDGQVVDAIRQMGETWDGKGPLGLAGEDIIRPARVLAVVNAFVAMVSARAYRDPMSFEKASNILLEESGSKFDRKPVSALINYLENRGGAAKWLHFREKPSSSAE